MNRQIKPFQILFSLTAIALLQTPGLDAWAAPDSKNKKDSDPQSAQKLHGRIEQEDFRIIRKPAKSSESSRIERNLQEASPTSDSPVDSKAFAGPLQGKTDDSQLNGAVETADFAKLPKGFDIGADKGSRELVLAWEKWHKQLAAAIYQVWNTRARSPGRAVLKITVYRNRTIVPEFLSCRGDSEFRRSIQSVFADINGNQGLTFPAKSERQQVSFEAEYIAGSHVDPGYSWLKGDYEKLRQDY